MINVNDYDGLTEDDVAAYIATLVIPEPDVKLDGDKVYKDGALWFLTTGNINIDEIRQMATDQYIAYACMDHFADRFKPYEPPEPIPPAPQPEPTEEELIQAELLLNQVDIITKQQEQDEVLAAILLNGLGV